MAAKTKTVPKRAKSVPKAKPAKAKPAKAKPAKAKPAKAKPAKVTASKRPASPTDAVLKELRELGLAYPGVHLKSPWPGHLDLAVNDKTFAYLSVEGEPFSISCKLPTSAAVALMLPHAQPTPYGLGKSGWVSITFPDGKVPIEMLKAWIDESYRAQAPKKLVKTLSG